MNFPQNLWWMALQALSVFTYFWVPSVIVLMTIIASLVFPKPAAWHGLLSLLGRAAILAIPAFFILVIGTAWLHWHLHAHESSLPQLLIWLLVTAQISLFALVFHRFKQARFQSIAAGALAFWCSYAANFVTHMAIRNSWP